MPCCLSRRGGEGKEELIWKEKGASFRWGVCGYDRHLYWKEPSPRQAVSVVAVVVVVEQESPMMVVHGLEPNSYGESRESSNCNSYNIIHQESLR
jgi:hypothetical protein